MMGDISCDVLINVFYVSLICIGLFHVTDQYRKKTRRRRIVAELLIHGDELCYWDIGVTCQSYFNQVREKIWINIEAGKKPIYLKVEIVFGK